MATQHSTAQATSQTASDAGPQGAQQPSPQLFFDTVRAYERTAALKAAIELDLFTAIGEGNSTAEAAARRCQASQRGTRILCDYLTVIGFLTKDNGRYALTPDTAMFLDRRSPAYAGAAVEFLVNPDHVEAFARLTEAVRTGRSALSEEASTARENPNWVKFARSMAALMRMPADLTAQRVVEDTAKSGGGPVRRVLDIAAGHGVYGIAVARRFPEAEVTALDWANVLEVAKENAQAAGISGRYRTIPGSAFEVEYGTGYDIVLLTNILHHFDPPNCEKMLRKVHAAVAPGGRAVTVEFVPNEDRVSPPEAAKFSIIMLANTPAGDAYTFAEFEKMFRNAGFRSTEKHSLAPAFFTVLISRK
jgi:2-polyprenyl-3-methyl-5-hydroxy-6-metoxy-1,4-benzoquinol methylase